LGGAWHRLHGHDNNMVETRVSQVACGSYVMPDGRTWAVQDFP